MQERLYSQRLGILSDAQLQAALHHFDLGRLVSSEPIPFGNFGQNIFVTSTKGAYVLRGRPHSWWQFPTEQFFTQQLHEKTQVPVPWPYLIDPATNIFGWSYAIMPRMRGIQLSDPQVKSQLQPAEKQGIAQALGKNLAMMQNLTWPSSGRYNPHTQKIEPFELTNELSWPPASTSVATQPTLLTYSEMVVARIRYLLARTQDYTTATTEADLTWVEEILATAQDALTIPFQPSIVMEDYKDGNLVVTSSSVDGWYVSGVFDLMGAYFGDGEADLSRTTAMYIEEDPQLARTFLQAYLHSKSVRPGFTQRFPVYMLLDRIILWDFFQRTNQRYWPAQWTFRDWASQYTSLEMLL